MGEFRDVPVSGGTNLRRGVSTKGDQDAGNVIGVLKKNDYTALAQCTGERVDQHNPDIFNRWWVLLETPLGRGWVNAVRIAEGDNDKPIDGVPKVATVFDGPDTPGAVATVHVVSGGATLRSGGSRQSDPDNAFGSIPAGSYRALAQCGGQEITIGSQSNFRWVLLETPHGPGWVSAVLIKEGPNGGRIPHVRLIPSVASIPPDLLP